MKTKLPIWRSATLALAALLWAIAATSAQFVSFDEFFLTIWLMATLCIVTLASVAVDFSATRRIQPLVTGLLMLASPPLVWFASFRISPWIALAVWALFHPLQFSDATRADGLVMLWHEDGFAGVNNFTYLVADQTDAISSSSAMDEWRKRHKLPCDVVGLLRLWPKLYLLTTFNCTLDQHRPDQPAVNMR